MDFDRWSMLGFATGAVELAWRYAQERTQFGKPICAHQSVRHDTVDARTQLQACRHRLYHAAWPAHEGRPCSVVSSMAKLFVGDTAVQMALKCEQVMGAYGTARDHDMERYVRDLLLMPIVGGSSKMQKNSIAARLWLTEQRQDLAAVGCSAARAVGPRGFASAAGAAGSARPDWLGAGIRFRLIAAGQDATRYTRWRPTADD